MLDPIRYFYGFNINTGKSQSEYKLLDCNTVDLLLIQYMNIVKLSNYKEEQHKDMIIHMLDAD